MTRTMMIVPTKMEFYAPLKDSTLTVFTGEDLLTGELIGLCLSDNSALKYARMWGDDGEAMIITCSPRGSFDARRYTEQVNLFYRCKKATEKQIDKVKEKYPECFL